MNHIHLTTKLNSHGNNFICTTFKENYTGEAPAQYDSSLTCFNTTTYTMVKTKMERMMR